jgi:hypothetical protein
VKIVGVNIGSSRREVSHRKSNFEEEKPGSRAQGFNAILADFEASRIVRVGR